MKNAKYLIAAATFAALAFIGFSAFTDVPEKASKNVMAQREAARNEFPFMTFITVDGVNVGTGILISPEWVLTNATLLIGSSSADLVFGIHDQQQYGQESEPSAVQVHVTSNDMTLHPDWNPNSPDNNLALIRLPSSLGLSPAIQPITALNLTQNWVGQSAKSIGWGMHLTNNVLRYTATPQVADVSIVAMQQANSALGYTFSEASNLAVTAPGASCVPVTLVTTDGAGGTQLVGLLNQFTINGSMAVYCRLDHFAGWVEQNTGVYLH